MGVKKTGGRIGCVVNNVPKITLLRFAYSSDVLLRPINNVVN